MTYRRWLRAAPLVATTMSLLAAPGAAAGSRVEFGERALERGHRGHDVRVLQSWLTELGFRTAVDGVFGSGTERNVERYDRANDLTVDGKVSRPQARRMRRQVEDDEATARDAAAGRDFGERALERGHRGHDVRVLQSWLTRLGFRTAVDGVFGSGTERNVERYDRANELTVDGKVSRPQARRMRRQVEGGGGGSSRRSEGESYDFGERTLRRGDRGHDVRVLQSWLTHLGIPTDVDGVFGRGTERNILEYEERNGIREDGLVSRAQARLMRRQIEGGEGGGGQTQAPVATSKGPHVFPIQGAHTYGDGIGAGRNHRGVDVFAECGTPLVAAQGGEVFFTGYHDRAGHYIVITGAESRQDYVYMHMRSAPTLRKGDTVSMGQQIGEVGETGNASGCHLHFELWSEPGWYRGGDFLDPMPALKSWDG